MNREEVYQFLRGLFYDSPGYRFTRPYLLPHLPKFQELEPHDLAAGAFRLSPDTAAGWMFSVPEIWQSWRCADWNHVFSLRPERPLPLNLHFEASYADIMFFIRWLRLDPFPLLRSPVDVGDTTVLRIAQWCHLHADSVFSEIFDIPDEAWDNEFGSCEAVQEARTRLLAENAALTPSWEDEFGLKDRMTVLLRELEPLG